MNLKSFFHILMMASMTASTLLMTFFLIDIWFSGEAVLIEPNRLILLSEIILLLVASVYAIVHLFRKGKELIKKEVLNSKNTSK